MKILAISHNYPTPERPTYGSFIHKQLCELSKQGHEITVLVPLTWRLWKQSLIKRTYEVKLNEVHVIYCWQPTFSNHRFIFWIYALVQTMVMFSFLKRLRREQFDVVYINNVFPDGWGGVQLAKTLGLPSLLIARGELIIYPKQNPLTALFCRWALEQASYFLATSEALLNEAYHLTNHKLKAQVLYNGVDLSLFQPSNKRSVLRANHYIPINRIILGYVGALTPDKGIPELIRVFARLASQRDIGLLLVGDGTLQKGIHQQLSDFPLILTGQIPHSQINEYLNCCDIFVFPSHFEGLPNAVLEAMAVGLPIVSTRVGGIPELVEHEINGFLVGGQYLDNSHALIQIDEDALFTYLMTLIDDIALRLKMGEKSRKIVSMRPTWDENVHTLESILQYIQQSV